MVLDQPGDEIGLMIIKPQTRADLAGVLAALNALIALALAGVVQQHGQMQRPAMQDFRRQLLASGWSALSLPCSRSRNSPSAFSVCSSTVKR
jgi:hypothetical protein